MFDSAAFDTSAFDVSSWEFGEVVEVSIDPGGYTGFIQNLHEEEELMIIIQSFLTMRNQ